MRIISLFVTEILETGVLGLNTLIRGFHETLSFLRRPILDDDYEDINYYDDVKSGKLHFMNHLFMAHYQTHKYTIIPDIADSLKTVSTRFRSSQPTKWINKSRNEINLNYKKL